MSRPCLGVKYIAPCKDCKKRTIDCHGKCKEYNEYRIKEKEFRKQKRIEERFGEYKPW